MDLSFLPASYSVHLVETPPNNPRSCRRIYINSSVMKNARLVAGDVLLLSKKRSLQEPFALGIAWPSLSLEAGTIGVSSSAMVTARVQASDTVLLCLIPRTRSAKSVISVADIKEAITLTLIETGDLSTPSSFLKDPVAASSSRDSPMSWLTLLLRETLVDIQLITKHQIIQVTYQGQKRIFFISFCSTIDSSIEKRLQNLSLTSPGISESVWRVTWDTAIEISSPPQISPTIVSPKTISADSPYAQVGGLEQQIQEVRDLIELPLSRPDLYREFGLKPPRGILLHGPPGTGKTHFAQAISKASGSSILTISGPELSSAFHGETESKLRAVFEEAKSLSPCIIVIDEVDAICPKREDSGAGVEARVVTTLLTLLDGFDDPSSSSDPPRVVVVATTNRPNAIDPALRRPGRFDREIEIGVPDAPARLSILRVLLKKIPHSLSTSELESLASRTHGYVGADLAAAVREAGSKAIKRWLAPDASIQQGSEKTLARLTYEDIAESIASVRPSALREYFVDAPTVRWEDIGGQSEVKQKLKESVEWPLLHWPTFSRLGVKPPKGVLLYGPPGCSKTLTAKALATESSINFIAVQGPELLNKYVGESERAVREIFRKARSAAPAIVFFDEIDALASSRSDDEGNSHQGVLTTLLNEMDGIQDLVGVVIVAATNRPEALDSAIMRPGRLDRILYVGPPSIDARRDILRIRTGKMAVDPTLNIEELAHLTEGCSGAEIAALCQEAALLTMRQNMDAPYVLREDFIRAAKNIRRQITPEMISKYQLWRDNNGKASV